jgi:hypothetical protein
MSVIRENYEKINIKFRSCKENIETSLLLEIFDPKEEQDFFIKELGSVTKKLFETMESEDANKSGFFITKNKFFIIFFTIFMLIP